MDDWLRKIVDEQVRQYGCVRPPWCEFPGEHPYSICWRMGGGEGHVMAWSAWWHERARSEAEALDYFRAWPPDAAWLAWAGHVVWPDVHEDDDEEVVRRLESLGIGTRAAWRAAFEAEPE